MKRTFEEHLLRFCDVGTHVQTCRRLWSKYQPIEETYQALYEVNFTGVPPGRNFTRQIYLVAPGRTRMVPGMPEMGESPAGDDLRLVYLYLDALSLLIQVFPTDMRLPQLRTVVTPGAIAPYFASQTDLESEHAPRVTVLKYKPEKRCTIRYDFPDLGKSALIGKTFHDGRGEQIFRLMRFLHSSLPVPKPCAYVPEFKLILMEALHGQELAALAQDPAFPLHLLAAARAVRDLHTLPVRSDIIRTVPLPMVSLNEEADHFARLAERFRQGCPVLEKQIAAVAADVLQKLKEHRSDQISFVHGELDPSQLLVSNSEIWFVDFDRFRLSHPATDVGRFLAYLGRLSFKMHGDAGRLAEAADLFLDEYLSHDPNGVRALIPVCQAMEYLKIAFIQFRRQKSRWERSVAGMLEMAGRLLQPI